MSSNDTETVTCTVRAEIFDWFEKFIKQACGPEVIIQCIPNDGHFNTHTSVEISGCSNQINKAKNCITSICEVQHYKMPWFKGAYYTVFESQKERIIEHMKRLNIDYFIDDPDTEYTMLGFTCMLFQFSADLDRAETLEIEEIFQSEAQEYGPVFISYPKSSVSQNHLSVVSTAVLTAFCGKFLSYLLLEDVLSLEIANGGPDPSLCYDRNLNHDIQYYLKENYSVLYAEQTEGMSFEQFKHREVLRYAIQKYHNLMNHITIPNILPATEIQSLSRSYNIKLEHNNITHIDFRTNGNLETINFCAIYHFDATNDYFFNYDSNQAGENYCIIFNGDEDSLDDLNCRKEFSTFAIKCQSICSTNKTNSILNWLVKHFKVPVVKDSLLVLQEFDLNQVPNNILRSLIKMMCQGDIEFHNMSFAIKTFLAILKPFNGDRIIFRKCHITSDNVGKMMNNSKFRCLYFYNMDLEINIVGMLQNVRRVNIIECHILSTNFNKLPINMKNTATMSFTYSSFDMTTLVRIIYGLRCIESIQFEACSLTPCVHVDAGVNHFTVTSEVIFLNIDFKLKEIFQIFKISQFEDIQFDTCQFHLDDFVASNKFKLKPVIVEFLNTKLDYKVLLTILDNLNNESMITISRSYILHTAAIVNISTKRIQMEYVELYDCSLKLQTLLNILSIMSTNTDVLITRCVLLDSSVVLPNSLIELTNLFFTEMKFSINELFGILGILKENSRLRLDKCEIDPTLTVSPKKKLQSDISIEFENMRIEEPVVLLLLQTDLVIYFDGCHFKEDNVLEIPFNSGLVFYNKIFDFSKHLKMLANTTPTSTMRFAGCYLFMTTNVIPNIVLVPRIIDFCLAKFDLDVLVTVMERLSDHTSVILDECVIKPRQVSSKLPIKIPRIYFQNMTLEIKTLLDLLKNCINLSVLIFYECEIVGSNSNDKIIPVSNELLANVTMNNISVQLKNVPYSSGLVQLCQQLTGNFIIEYYGKLSNQAIIELYIKTPIYGSRLKLMDQACTKLFYFELFAEYLHYLGHHKLEPKTDMMYDAPTFIIPFVPSLSLAILNDLKALKIKLVATIDGTTKLEFLRDGKPIDLFYEMNDLPDDSEECMNVDYY